MAGFCQDVCGTFNASHSSATTLQFQFSLTMPGGSNNLCLLQSRILPSTINFSSDFIFPRKIAIHFLPNINLNSANFSCKIVCFVKIATVTPGGLKSLLYIATICVLSCRDCCGFPLSYLEFQKIHLYRYDPVGVASWIA